MKSSFGRSFSVFAGILLVALTVLGGSFQMMVQDFLTDTTFDSLEQDAQIIADLAASYMEDDSLSGREFLMNLDIASKVSGSDAVICNSDGKVTICSDSLFGCKHMGLYVNEEYLQKVLSQGSDRATGLIKGLYSEERFLVALPVTAADGDTGIIIVSSPSASVNQVLTKISNIFLTTAVCVILVSVAAVSFFARRESKPLQDMAKAANAFGHGDLEARVKIEEGNSEEMEELALAFNNMACSLQKSEYRRQEFVANVSHELKTPMTTISGYVDGMLDKTIPEDKWPHYLQIVSDETKRLSRLVDAILKLSRLENRSTPMKKEVLEVGDLISSIIATHEAYVSDSGLKLIYEVARGVRVRGDADMIRQATANLISNAVRYTPEGGTITVSVSSHEGMCAIAVRDTGIGLSPDEAKMVFSRFWRADAGRTRESGGLGIGLSVVKEIVDRHNGYVDVEGEKGVGACFTINLPLYYEGDEQREQRQQQRQQQQQQREQQQQQRQQQREAQRQQKEQQRAQQHAQKTGIPFGRSHDDGK